jgi:limonene-1,2-epoxide hydrolase
VAMTHALRRRDLLALAAAAVVPASMVQDGEAASIRAVLVRLRTHYEALDVAALLALMAPDVRFADPTFQLEAAGVEALRALFTGHARVIAELRLSVEREIVLPPWAIVQQTQAFAVKTAGGLRRGSVHNLSLFRIEGGRVAEWWDYADVLGYQRQVRGTATGGER